MSNIVPLQGNIIYTETEQELVNQIQTRILVESQNTLDDFAPASPLAAISEGQAYAINFLGENINSLPDEFVLKYMEILGVNVSTARNSSVGIEFTINDGFTENVIIPRGFRMFTSTGIVFTLDDPVILNGELPTVIGYARSVGVGSVTNVEANSITGFSLAIPGLQRITNPDPARGGANQESENSAISRGLSFLTFRNLTRPRDYEIATQALVGSDFTVKAYSYFEIQDFLFNNDSIQLLNDRETDPTDDLSRRNVYLVISSNSGFGVNEALQNQIKNYLLPRLQTGTEVKFILPQRIEISIDIECAGNPSNLTINKMVSTMRLNQSILFRGIGRNLNNSTLYKQAESFFPVALLETNILDPEGSTLITYGDRSDIVQSMRPNTVFLLGTITITTQSGIIYTYEATV